MQEIDQKDTQTKQSLDLAESASGANEAKSLDSIDSKDSAEVARAQKVQKVINGAYDLSLGISIVLAILLGLGIGYVMQRIGGSVWLLWLGIFWGVGAAGLNIYKAYKRTKAELDALADDPRYSYKKSDEGN